MKPTIYVVWSLEWGNPYTEPPEGMPRTLAEETVVWGEKPLNLYKMSAPGDGYACCFHAPQLKPPRKLSEATKQSIRRKSMKRRVQAKAPLFAETIIAAELAAQPDYFGDDTK